MMAGVLSRRARGGGHTPPIYGGGVLLLRPERVHVCSVSPCLLGLLPIARIGSVVRNGRSAVSQVASWTMVRYRARTLSSV